MKILYAASEREGGKIQLLRFMQALSNSDHVIRIAAYSSSNPGFSVDWNLNALRDFWSPNKLIFDSDKLEIYYSQIKTYNPDLIISDLEPLTSHMGQLLGKKIWQVSPLLLQDAMPLNKKHRTGTAKYHVNLFPSQERMSWNRNVINNADRKFVYSHIGDTGKLDLMKGFEWVRPYYVEGKVSAAARHQITIPIFHNKKDVIRYLQKYQDVVVFSGFVEESFKNISLKDIYNWKEYAYNLKNCDYFICQGHADFLADAFYNGKRSMILPNFNDLECMINVLSHKYFKLGKILYNTKETETGNWKPPSVQFNPKIKFLHQHLENI